MSTSTTPARPRATPRATTSQPPSTPSRLKPIPPPPRRKGTPVVRLDSIKNPRPRAASQVGKPQKSVPAQCSNPDCGNSDVGEDDGKLICRSCGFVLQDAQITQELTFGEASNGAAVVQGVFVGANDETARNPAIGAVRVAGGMDSRQVTERNGLHAVNNLVAALRLGNTHKERAMQVWKLTMNINFIQGRTTREVAAVCLYIACRRDNECKLMLIDFSELLEMNVFKLGQTYNTLVKELGLRSDSVGIYETNPENLIQRFAQDLEFGPDEHRIANEAVQILKRMRRDWISVGRRPAGVCGAALILAARMNNYRRTVREVVYTAKVTDITINKRLDEFKYTESSKLTVAEFRHHGLNLERDHDPPAYYQQFLSKRKRRKRVRQDSIDTNVSQGEPSRAGTIDPSQSVGPHAIQNDRRSTSRHTTASERARRDSQAMPPPPIPIDPSILEPAQSGTPSSEGESPESDEPERSRTGEKRKRGLGRPRGGKNKWLRTQDGSPDDDGQPESSKTAENRKRGPGRPRGNKNKPPPTPTQPTIDDEESDVEAESFRAGEKRKRRPGRPRGARNKPLPTPTQAAINDENQMESEMNTILNDSEAVAEATEVHKTLERSATQQLASPPPTQEQRPITVDSSSETEEPFMDSDDDDEGEEREPRKATTSVTSQISSSTHIEETEFADDIEVQNCLLTPAEVTIKEKLWVHENADYLRKQQARRLRAQLAQANGGGQANGQQGKSRKRRKTRMGDVSDYKVVHQDGTVSGPRTPAEAIRLMMEKRAFSKKINYQAIEDMLKVRKDSSASAAGSGSGTGSGASNTREGTGELANTEAGARAGAGGREGSAVDGAGGTLSGQPTAGRRVRETLSAGPANSPMTTMDQAAGGTATAPVFVNDEEDDEEGDSDDYFSDGHDKYGEQPRAQDYESEDEDEDEEDEEDY